MIRRNDLCRFQRARFDRELDREGSRVRRGVCGTHDRPRCVVAPAYRRRFRA